MTPDDRSTSRALPLPPPPGVAMPDAWSETDRAAMDRALALAEQGCGLTEPNPRVGCVIIGSAGHRIGEGHTQQAGGPHAEVMAMRQAREAGADLRGATAYVTLEPCAHHGRTPPCADALVAAGLGRVVAAVRDPFPAVAGRGLARLAQAGIRVDLGLRAHEAVELNIGFFSRVLRQRPWVRLKVATSLDGRTALADGSSQWITSPGARADGHAWRRRASALLTGAGTVREDDPRLDVRLVTTARQPLRVVVDARLETPPGARILAAPGAVRVYTAADADRQQAWQAAVAEHLGGADAATHITCTALPGEHRNSGGGSASTGKVDLPAMLTELAGHGVNELHVEAGERLNGSFVREGLVDEYLVYLAPRLLGPGRALAHLEPLAHLTDATTLAWTGWAPVGPDLRLLARPPGRSAIWLPAYNEIHGNFTDS